ncbi:MAG: PD-(D/E)XK nuclease family protein [Candidatus Aureabacteria bacterium]|nr:PD-(D/E)XK nuclease family protein [Candidatus Auribacterota bacterium]
MQRLSRPRGMITRTVEGMVEILGKVVPIRRAVTADAGDPLSLAEKGALCSTCEFLQACPAWPVKPRDFCADTPEAYDDRIRMSYSKLGSYKRCPRAWKKGYLDGIGLQPRPFFSFGTAMHEAMEIFYDPRGRRKSSLRYLLGLWDQAFQKYPAGYRDQEEARVYHGHGVEMIRNYHASFVAATGYQPAHSVEEYFELPLGRNVVMTGYIDRIDRRKDGTFEIVDYKTEPTMRSQAELDHDDQLTIYFWAAETMLKLKIKQLALYMMKFGSKAATVRRPEDIPQVVAAIDAVAAEMRENIRRHREEHDAAEAECLVFPPRKNKYCRSCDYLENCPLKPDILSDGEIRSMEYSPTERSAPWNMNKRRRGMPSFIHCNKFSRRRWRRENYLWIGDADEQRSGRESSPDASLPRHAPRPFPASRVKISPRGEKPRGDIFTRRGFRANRS